MLSPNQGGTAMLDTLQNFALPTCWAQGMQHYRVVPAGSIQPPEKPVETESRLFGTIRGSLGWGELPKDKVAPKKIDAELLMRQLCNDYPLGLETLQNLANALEEEQTDPWTGKTLLEKVEETLDNAEVPVAQVLKVLQHAVNHKLIDTVWAARELHDTEAITYNNHQFVFKYSELCQLSPREGMIAAWCAKGDESDPVKKNKHAAHFSFHLSRAVWSVVQHAYENSRNIDTWMFIVGASLSRWRGLSLVIVSVSSAAAFMKSDNELSTWLNEKTGPASTIIDPIATAADEARKILHSNDAWLGKLSGLLVVHALVPQISSAVPFLSLLSFGGTVVTCLAIGDFIGADDPRRSVPLSEVEAQGEEEE